MSPPPPLPSSCARLGAECTFDGSVREINWDYIGDAVPAFLTIIMIPLTYKYAPFPAPAAFTAR